MKYSVVGLGKLGASMAAAIAGRGFPVIGVDVNQKSVDLMNGGRAPVQETGLDDAIQAARKNLRCTMDHAEAVLDSDVTFVVVPTPSDARGAFSLQYAGWAFKAIGRALAKKKGYHLVVLTSTVLPGSTRYGLLPILEQESGKKCGRDFGLCYSPEFIALGTVLRDFLNPDFTLVGEHDEHAGTLLETCYAEILATKAPCKRMSLENAELAKISVNTFVTMKMTFANMLAELCEKIPGGNVDAVTGALGADRRIGPKYLTGALGYGGPCFPRDNVAMSFFARSLGTKADLAETTDRFNRALARAATDRVRPLLQPGATVAVLGLAYKPLSNVVEESQGLHLVKELSRSGARVVAYDPLANANARTELGDQAVVLESVKDCLDQSDVVIIANPDPAFRKLTEKDFPKRRGGVTVVDFWRILEGALQGSSHVRYVAAGRSNDDGANRSLLARLWDGAIQGPEGT